MPFKVSSLTRFRGRNQPDQTARSKCPLGLCRRLQDFEALEYRPDLHRTCGHCAGILPWCAPVAVPHTAIPDQSRAAMPTGNAYPTRRRRFTTALTDALAVIRQTAKEIP